MALIENSFNNQTLDLKDDHSIINYFYYHPEKAPTFYKSYLPKMLSHHTEVYITFTNNLVYLIKITIDEQKGPKFLSNALFFLYENYCERVFDDLLPLINRNDYLLEIKVLMVKYKKKECFNCTHLEINQSESEELEELELISVKLNKEKISESEMNDLKINELKIIESKINEIKVKDSSEIIDSNSLNHFKSKNESELEKCLTNQSDLQDLELIIETNSDLLEDKPFDTNNSFFDEFFKYYNYTEKISCKLINNKCIHTLHHEKNRNLERNTDLLNLFLVYKDKENFIVKLMVDFLTKEYSFEIFDLLLDYKKTFLNHISKTYKECNLISLGCFISFCEQFKEEEIVDKGIFVLHFIKIYKCNLRKSSNVIALYLQKYDLKELIEIYYECVKEYYFNERLLLGLKKVLEKKDCDFEKLSFFVEYHRENHLIVPCLVYLPYKYVEYFVNHYSWRVRYSLWEVRSVLSESDLEKLRKDKVYEVRKIFKNL